MQVFVMRKTDGMKINIYIYICTELIGKRICNKEFIGNPRNCKCKCGKSCDVGEY